MKVDAQDRRKHILQKLSGSEQPITGNELAESFQVSRQVIVQDIAILRAAGNQILATPQGYLLTGNKLPKKFQRTFAVQHDRKELEKELLIMVDAGGNVLDVIVEHPLYGELRGLLMLSCREDVYSFVKNLARSGAKPLSSLTGGVHLHTVEAASEKCLERIEEKLSEENILLKK